MNMVVDYFVHPLAGVHLKAVDFVPARMGCEVFNLGTGRGYSVLEVVKAFEAASGRDMPLDMVGRRTGDVAQLTADPAKANAGLGRIAACGIDVMCVDAWRWQQQNPVGVGQ